MPVNNISFDFLNKILLSDMAKNISLQGLLSPIDILLIKHIIQKNKKVLFIVPDEQTALKYQKDFNSLLNIEADIFPMQEISFYSELEKNYYIYNEQINILLSKPAVILLPLKAIFEKFPKEQFYIKNSIDLKVNDTIDYSEIVKKLCLFGYKRVTSVNDIGEFALRGDILDIYSFSKNPIRIEFFADTIEDIRYFDSSTQKSFEHIKSTKILPIYKFILNNDNIEIFKNQILNIDTKDDFCQNIKNELIEKIDNQGYFEGIEYYQNLFSDSIESVLKYFKEYIVILKESSHLFSKFSKVNDSLIEDYNSAISSNFKLPLKKLNHLSENEFIEELKHFKRFCLDNFLSEDCDEIIDFNLDIPPKFSSDIDLISKFIKKSLAENSKLFICTNYPTRLKEIFDEFEIFSDNIYYFSDISFGGCIVDDKRISTTKLIFLSDKELFNKFQRDITVKKYGYRKQSNDFIDSINDIKEGEYVVHSVHGIGIYNGLTKQELDGNQKDYLEIQFQGTDKLFMPAEQINLLCRYRGSQNIKPKLSKMGGNAWEATKTKAKKELETIAYDLLDLYAKRKLAHGIEFEPDTTWQFEMEDSFEYIETPDQMKAIKDVKADMEISKPMDRLLCADVGFGKTEVAMRAIFKAVMSGYQAAFIAPTTILTMQHFETLLERFNPFNVRVGVLNRFSSKKEQNDTVKKINSGEIDVVIGTHRLLSDDVKFKKLGILVIDEEHKFGVRHKEKLKKFKENIDVLSLSATPIPRTLNMALSGLKDLSVINTPPKNRLPIKTYVCEFNSDYVKNAVNQEIQRDGQVFYLYNRVETIELFKQKLQEIVPNARIAVAHGQMNEKDLEKIIYDFSSKKYDVLLSTTIIESGLDIPNANTIIIHDSDKFGLAQLYQLRGRVGRSDRQAYCFCMYKKSKELTEQARKRLESIKDFTNLGSGYQIALRDIEIRGVGNILGTRQHGQMVNVGFDTYCSLLAECIDEIKQKRESGSLEVKKPQTQAIIDINADAYIPESWAQTYEQKILEYKRLSDVSSINELDEIILNFKDRFAKIPECVENLTKLIRLRILATNAKITHVQDTGSVIRIYTPFSKQEWQLLRNNINFEYIKYFTYTIPPNNKNGAKGILLMNKNEDDFNKIFNKLSDLFYHVANVIFNFEEKI